MSDQVQHSAEVDVAALRDLLAVACGPICHQARNPLTVSYGFARLLQSGVPSPEELEQFSREIADGMERVDAVLEHLSMMARLATGRRAIQRSATPVPAVVNILLSKEPRAENPEADYCTKAELPGMVAGKSVPADCELLMEACELLLTHLGDEAWVKTPEVVHDNEQSALVITHPVNIDSVIWESAEILAARMRLAVNDVQVIRKRDTWGFTIFL